MLLKVLAQAIINTFAYPLVGVLDDGGRECVEE